MFRLKRPQRMVLVTDIDDASVGAAIVSVGHTATVVQSVRTNVPFEQRSLEQSATVVVALLEETVMKLVQSYSIRANREPIVASYAILRSPWTRFRTAQAEEVYEQPVLISEDRIESLASTALQAPSDRDSAPRLETGIVHVYLNGYITNQPAGKRVTRAMVTAYESTVNATVKSAVENVLLKALPGRAPTLRSSMCALLAVSGEHLPESQRSVIIDVGSSSTHIALMLNEAIMQSTDVPVGLISVVTRVAGTRLAEEILSQLRMLASDTCATETCKALKDSLARIEPDLAKEFGEAFASLASKRRLPNTALLSAPEEVAPWMAGFFSRIDFAQFTTTQQPFSVELLTAEHLTDAVVWEGHAPDTGLSIAAGYVNILSNSA